jgi:hypothetical protein
MRSQTPSDYACLDRPEILAFLFHNNIFMAGLDAYLAAIRETVFSAGGRRGG